MTDFAEQMRAFTLKVQVKSNDVFVGAVTATRDSIVEGSEITGAPGQPVDTGALRASWQTVFESPTSAVIGTNLVYAPIIEDGIRDGKPLHLRSQVGGFHSVKATVLNFDRLVESVAKEGQ